MMKKRHRYRNPLHRSEASIAAPPGTLVSPPGSHETSVAVIAYGPDRITEEVVTDLSRLKELGTQYPVVWVNMVGLASVATLQGMGDILGLHRLGLEDVLNVPQRPKLDDFGDHQFIVARMPLATSHLETEQLSLFLGKSFVFTVQEKPGDCFDPIRKRILEGRPRFRNGGPDYLVYAILDALVDSYFPLLDHVGGTLDNLEEQIFANPDQKHLEHLHALKRDLIALRRYLWPLRELNALLIRPDQDFFSEHTKLYMRDCYDHSVHALDLVDSHRDLATGLMEFHLAMLSQRMNEVMKVLTIIATLFIPLSFIAGLYGMNFNPEVSRWNMPELSWTFGYPAALGVMILCGGLMLLFFWKKGWFR
jgi:magnesium transporter